MTDHQAPDNGLPAPEWLWVWRPGVQNWDDIVSASHGYCPRDGREVVKYVPATALEAAQARIWELGELLDSNLTAAYLAGQKAARREALEAAANTERECPTHVTDAYRLGWSDAMKVRTERIRALMEKPNDQP